MRRAFNTIRYYYPLFCVVRQEVLHDEGGTSGFPVPLLLLYTSACFRSSMQDTILVFS